MLVGFTAYLVRAPFGLVGLLCILTPGGHAYALNYFIFSMSGRCSAFSRNTSATITQSVSHQGLGPKISQGHSTLNTGALVKIPIPGGLSHSYERKAA